MSGVVSSALHALRQTDHELAVAMEINLDGDRQGRNTDAGLPYNFDPLRHLLYSIYDFDNDGRPEVVLLFDWPYARGNQEASGVVMVSTRNHGWRIGCNISDWGDEGPRGGVRLLDSRSHGWRNFRTSDAVYAWRPLRGEPGAMECRAIRAVPRPSRAAR